MPVWSERIRYRTHPPDPRYEGAVFTTQQPEVYRDRPSHWRQPVWYRYAKHILDREQVGDVTPSMGRPGHWRTPIPFKYASYYLSGQYQQRPETRPIQDIGYYQKYGRFDDPSTKRVESLTWTELKQRHPALYLTPLPGGGYGVEFDIKRWKREQWEALGRQEWGGLKQASQAITGSFLNIFDPGYWLAEDKSKYLYLKEYGITKQMNKGDVLGAFWTGAEPAYMNVVFPLAGGYVLGVGSTALTGYIAGKYGAGSAAMWSFKTLQAGAAGGMMGYTAAHLKKTYDIEGTRGLVREGVTFGVRTAFGIGGYISGGRTPIRGATPYEWGARRGFTSRITKMMKTREISPEQGGRVLEASKLEFELRRGLHDIIVEQKSPDFYRVQTLEKQPVLRSYFQRHLIRRKSGIFGSLSEQRQYAHDIDIMYRNLSQGLREDIYASYKLGAGNIKNYADIKPWQRTHSIVGRLGTTKQPWYKTIEGYRLMRISESAMRHGESSLELAHLGRVKDISRSVELYTRLWETAGKPPALKYTLTRYSEIMSQLEKTPLVMSKKESLFVYGGKSFAERWAAFKNRIYSKIAPENWYEQSFQKTMGLNISSTKSGDFAVKLTGLPPSPSPSVSLFLSYPSGVLSGSLSVGSKQLKSFSNVIKKYPSVYYPSQKSFQSQIASFFQSVIPSSMKSPYRHGVFSPSLSLYPSVSPSPYPSTPQSISSIVSSFPSQYVSPSLYGRGRKYFIDELWARQYRERKFKLPDLFQLMGVRINNKTGKVNLNKLFKINFKI